MPQQSWDDLPMMARTLVTDMLDRAWKHAPDAAAENFKDLRNRVAASDTARAIIEAAAKKLGHEVGR